MPPIGKGTRPASKNGNSSVLFQNALSIFSCNLKHKEKVKIRPFYESKFLSLSLFLSFEIFSPLSLETSSTLLFLSLFHLVVQQATKWATLTFTSIVCQSRDLPRGNDLKESHLVGACSLRFRRTAFYLYTNLCSVWVTLILILFIGFFLSFFYFQLPTSNAFRSTASVSLFYQLIFELRQSLRFLTPTNMRLFALV